MADIAVQVERSNGRSPKRLVTLSVGDAKYQDSIDPFDGFQRQKLLDRAAPFLKVARHRLSGADTTIVSAAEKTDEAGDAGRAFKCYSMAELDALELSIDYIFRGALVADTPGVIGGREKVCKTQVGLDCAISMATATAWLGHFESVRAARCVYFAGEGGLTFIRDSARRIAERKGKALSDIGGLWVCDEVPSLDSDRDVAAATRVLQDHEAEFAFFDPLYLMLAGQAANASNVYAMGAMLGRMLRVCREGGATPVLSHHFRKTQPIGQAPDLTDLAQAGCAEFAGQWLLINRQQPYDEERPGEHDLLIRLGSRMGFSSKWALHVSEGTPNSPGGRYWRPEVFAPSEARERVKAARETERERQQEEKLAGWDQKILRTMARLTGVQSKSRIKEESGLFGREFPAAFASLLQKGAIVPGSLLVSNKKTPIIGYQLAEQEV